nr:hypothetical protein [Tanacetum cinerariifolium]
PGCAAAGDGGANCASRLGYRRGPRYAGRLLFRPCGRWRTASAGRGRVSAVSRVRGFLRLAVLSDT